MRLVGNPRNGHDELGGGRREEDEAQPRHCEKDEGEGTKHGCRRKREEEEGRGQNILFRSIEPLPRGAECQYRSSAPSL